MAFIKNQPRRLQRKEASVREQNSSQENRTLDDKKSRQVFLGGASGAIEKAKEVAKVLRSADCEPLPWWDPAAFHVGFSLLHNIQSIPDRISGAVFLATPDDSVVGQNLKIPRTNVMLELGHFMGVPGPSNVAICRYGESNLPSDLNGVTYIDMGPCDRREIARDSKIKIKDWAENLPYTAGISITQRVHGYTGRWEVFGRYSKWDGRELVESNGDRVELTGTADLWVSDAGASGYGVMHGQLTLDLKTLGRFAEFRIISLMNNISCDRMGALSFESEIFCHQLVYNRTPHDPESRSEVEEELIGYPRHSWSLRPSVTRKGQLCGRFTLPDYRTAAEVEVTKTTFL